MTTLTVSENFVITFPSALVAEWEKPVGFDAERDCPNCYGLSESCAWYLHGECQRY